MDDEEQQLAKLNEARARERTHKESAYEDFMKGYEDLGGGESDFSEDDFEDIKQNPPSIPDTPFIMYGIAGIKDIADIIIEFTKNGFFAFPVIGQIFYFIFTGGGWFISITFAIIIWVWIFTKSTMVRKMIIKKMLVPIILVPLAGLIPGIDAFPDALITVYLVRRSEYGIVKKIVDAFEKVKNMV